MALAALCSQLQDHSHSYNQPRTSEHPRERGLSSQLNFQAFIVDHGLRNGSDVEAEAVAQILKDRGSDSKKTITSRLNKHIRDQNANSQDGLARKRNSSFLAEL